MTFEGGEIQNHNIKVSGNTITSSTTSKGRPKFGALLQTSNKNSFNKEDRDGNNSHSNYSSRRNSSVSVAISPRHSCNNNYVNMVTTSNPPSGDTSPYMSPWNQPSPYSKSPWILQSPIISNRYLVGANASSSNVTGLVGSIVREEGHVYSLAAYGDLLYTGSDSKNIRVWKNLKEFTGFKSNSGLVKAIVVYGNRVFTGHQDGKIRIWKVSSRDQKAHKRTGSLPTLKDSIKSSINPGNYVKVRRNRNVLRIKHFDAVSCMSLNEEQSLLYTGSWDKTLKVWRVSDYKCLESINAHDDAINSVAAGFDSLVFTGSADGTVKVWRRELEGNRTRHFLVQTLVKQESAVTSIAVNREFSIIYCGSSDGLVNFWEREKHLSHGVALRGHKLAVLCLATAGRLVFSGSADKNICVWRREAGGVHSFLSVLTGHSGPVKCLALESDRYPYSYDDEDRHPSDDDDDLHRRWILYSGSLDRSVKIWRVSENKNAWRDQYQSPRISTHASPSNNY